MTPAEHIAKAEQLLSLMADTGQGWDENEYLGAGLIAVAHSVIAIAVELGAPHPSAAPEVSSA